jgi:hypothetical protein
MKYKSQAILLPEEIIEKKIFLIRGRKVMLDFHLAEIYGVSTKILNKAVARNRLRFPEDFLFQITLDEWNSLRFQIGTSNRGGRGGRRYIPNAFTEHGAIMLASVLNSESAINAGIFVVRAFVRLREFLAANIELAAKFKELESKIAQHDSDIQAIFDAIRQLMAPPEQPKKEIGFRVKETKAQYKTKR